MAIFDYRGTDGREVIGEAYQLATYTTMSPIEDSGLQGLLGLVIHDPSPEASQVPEGWSELGADDLGVDESYINDGGLFGFGSTPYYTDDGTLIDGEAKVLIKTDENGNIVRIAISFAATNSIGSVIDFEKLANLTYDNGFEYLYEAVRDYAVANGLTGSDVLFTGYSLGGGATNLAALEKDTRLDGFYADSDYIGFASPAIAEGENVYNFGFENDVVHRVGGSDFENPPSLLDVFLGGNNDLEAESSVDNLVLFDDTYANPLFPYGDFGLLNLFGWVAHLEGAAAGPRLYDTIANSNFYDYMEKDSSIIVSNLSDLSRGLVWVEPVNRATGDHLGLDSFVLGSKDNDLLGDSTGNDFLDGFSGNDTFRISEGNDTVHGGAGSDTVNMHGSLSDYEIMRLSDGTTYFFDTDGRYGLEELIDVEQVDLGFAQTYDLTDSGVKWGWFNAADYESVTEGSDGSDTLEGNQNRNRIFGLDGDDNITGNGGSDLLHGGDGADILSGNSGNDQLYGAAGDDTLTGGAGNDVLSGGLGADTFIFTGDAGNDVISDYNMGEQGEDLISFSSDVFSSYEDVMAATTQQGDDILISYGEDSLLIENTSLGELDTASFIFV